MRKFKMKRLSYFTLICLSIIGVQANANAGVISLVDLNPGDAMSVTGQVQSGNILTVSQTYGDNKLIPFINHNPIFPDAGNLAIVNQASGYFDTKLTYSGLVSGEVTELTFQILNGSQPYDWYDYHFEFWTVENGVFTARHIAPWAAPNPPSFLPTLNSDKFTGKFVGGEVGDFYSTAGSGEKHQYNTVGTYTLRVELFALEQSGLNEIGIRQIATTTPEPASMAIFGIGGSMLMYARRRRARSTAKANEVN